MLWRVLDCKRCREQHAMFTTQEGGRVFRPLNERKQPEVAARDRNDKSIHQAIENTAGTKENDRTVESVRETAGRVRLEHSAWMGERRQA